MKDERKLFLEDLRSKCLPMNLDLNKDSYIDGFC